MLKPFSTSFGASDIKRTPQVFLWVYLPVLGVAKFGSYIQLQSLVIETIKVRNVECILNSLLVPEFKKCSVDDVEESEMTYFKYPERRSDTRERDTRSQYLCAKVSDFLSRGEKCHLQSAF